jgi:hypothetical protein
MKGVAYQQNYSPNGSTGASTTYTDPLADGALCSRDIPYLKQIYTNVIRVYAIDPAKNHDDCMEQLAAADIYVVADLAEPGTSIQSDTPSWNVELYSRYTGVIDALGKYKNVIGFFAGNENVSAGNQTSAAAFVKAAVRDCKGYIHSQGYRNTLGVGYATADVPTRDDLAHYFACEPANSGNSTQIDFWGYNVYSWCGNSNYATSSYGERVDFFSDYPVPVFFAEYGCIEGITGGATRRPFTEVQVLYGNMTDVFSGGIVYEYFMGENDYGLVSIDGSSVSPYPDFTSLQSQLAKVSPTITKSSDYKPANSAPACPTDTSTWEAVASPLPPSPNSQMAHVSPKTCSATSSQPTRRRTEKSSASSAAKTLNTATVSQTMPRRVPMARFQAAHPKTSLPGLLTSTISAITSGPTHATSVASPLPKKPARHLAARATLPPSEAVEREALPVPLAVVQLPSAVVAVVVAPLPPAANPRVLHLVPTPRHSSTMAVLSLSSMLSSPYPLP